nr:MAG TPA: hypothetical protein [Caudoviricetes sp.]
MDTHASRVGDKKMVAQVAQIAQKVRKPLGILGLRRATTPRF